MKKLLLLPLLLLSISFAIAQTTTPKMAADTTEIYTAVQQQAQFKGGLKAFGDYLGKNIVYPESAKKQNIQGIVYLTFVVERNGSISNIKVIRGVVPALDTEAVRVMTASPKWEPGRQNDIAIRQQYTVPISFTLSNK